VADGGGGAVSGGVNSGGVVVLGRKNG